MLRSARKANCRTSSLGSSRACRRADSAGFAADPMPLSAMHAPMRDPSSAFLSRIRSDGSAGAASAPISPIACAARARTRLSLSLSAVMSAGRHDRMSSLGSDGLYQLPARTVRAKATFLLTRMSGSLKPRDSAGSASSSSRRSRSYSSSLRCSSGSSVPSDGAMAGNPGGKSRSSWTMAAASLCASALTSAACAVHVKIVNMRLAWIAVIVAARAQSPAYSGARKPNVSHRARASPHVAWMGLLCRRLLV